MQPGLVALSKNDIVVDKSALGQAAGGASGSAIPSLSASTKSGAIVNVGDIRVSLSSSQDVRRALESTFSDITNRVIQEINRREFEASSGIGR